jgi:hypothetical protein
MCILNLKLLGRLNEEVTNIWDIYVTHKGNHKYLDKGVEFVHRLV